MPLDLGLHIVNRIYDSPREFHKPRVVVEGISKGDKANLRRKCKNFKFNCGVLYFRRVKKGEVTRKGGRFVLGPKTKKDAFWSHAMLELKGNKYVVTLVDYFSKWPEGAPLKDKTAASVALFLFETFCSLIKVVNSSQDDWDEHLSAVLFAYQTSVQKATKLTPFEIMYCRKPKLPIDMEYAMSSTENGDGARNDESDGDVHTGDGDGALNDELDGDVYTGDGDGALNDESDGDVHTGDGDGAPNDESDGDVHSGDGNCEIQKSKNTSLEGPSSTYEWNPDEIVHQATKMVQIKKMITETTMSNIEKAQQKEFHPEELVLLQNSHIDSKKGDKLQPRWLEPCRVYEALEKGVCRLENAYGRVLKTAVNRCRLKKIQ
eukprot:Em0001g2673a